MKAHSKRGKRARERLSMTRSILIVHKNWNGANIGVQIAIPSGIDTSQGETNAYPVSDSTIIYGNGTMNPVLSYAVEEDRVLEMQQKK